jgi:dolichol-phosphate mannosyltransferase
MDYSLILPVYNEEENLNALYTRLIEVMKTLEGSYELIFVNDGSFDETPSLLKKLHEKDKHVKVINFSRNFGHQVAVSAGLQHAKGNHVAILDADLQDPPEVLPTFFEYLHQGNDVVYAVRTKRKEGFFKKMAYSFFYRILQNMANIHIPLDSGDFCVMNQKVVRAVNMLPERNRFVRGLRSWVGFKQVGVEYERAGRQAGESKYNLTRLMKLAFDGIFSFSYMPLQIMFYGGIVGVFLGILGSIVAVYLRFFTTAYSAVPGFATTIILIMLVGGLQMFAMGVLGEYLRRVYDEVKQRPQYIIDSTLGL